MDVVVINGSKAIFYFILEGFITYEWNCLGLRSDLRLGANEESEQDDDEAKKEKKEKSEMSTLWQGKHFFGCGTFKI